MILKKIRAKNFLSYGNNWTEIDLNTNELVAIIGTNGSGKSSIVTDAIHYAFTGKAYRNINKPQLINQYNKKDMMVELELDFKGSDILVRRGMYPNVFEIYKDGQLIGENSSIVDYQTVLENMLEIDSKTIRQTMMMSSRYYTPFLQLNPADKRNFIESILSIKMFSAMCENLKQRITNLKQEDSFLIKDLDKVRSNISLLQDMTKKQKKEIDKEKKTIQKRIHDAEKEIAHAKKEIATFHNKESHLKDKIIELQEKLILADKIQEKNAKLQVEVANLAKRIAFFKENDSCPLCLQDIDHVTKKKRLNEFLQIEEKLNEKTQKISEALEKIQKINTKISTLKQGCKDIQFDVSNLNGDIKVHERQILNDQVEFNRLIEKSTSEEENNIKKFELEKQQIEERRHALSIEQSRSSELIKLLSEKGIKKFILRKYIPVLNKLVNNYLTMLDAQYQIMFDDEVNERIIARGYEELNYNSFSGGERQRVDLALLFSFLELSRLKNSVETNVIILDETLDASLDSTGINGVFSILHHLKRQGYTVFVVSHRSEVSDYFDKVIKVSKKRFSEIEEC